MQRKLCATSSFEQLRETFESLSFHVAKDVGKLERELLGKERPLDYFFTTNDLQQTDLQTALQEMDTGDLVFFVGLEPFSMLSKTFYSSKYSHLGMVVKLPKYQNRPLIFESTIEGEVPDVQDNYIKFGTQLVDLQLKIRTYYGAAVWRRLNFPRTPEMLETTRAFIEEVRGRPYELSKLDLIRSLFGSNTRSNTQSYFCSELVADIYMRLGIINKTLLSDNYLPSFFSNELGNRLPLVEGVSLSPELVIHKCNPLTPYRELLIENKCAPRMAVVEMSQEVLEVQVREGKYLTMQLGKFGLEDLPDDEPNPFCEIYLGIPPAQAAYVRTAAVEGHSPRWNETLTLPFVPVGGMVKIYVKHSRPVLEDCVMGYAVLDLSELKVEVPREEEVRMQQGFVSMVFTRMPKSLANA